MLKIKITIDPNKVVKFGYKIEANLKKECSVLGKACPQLAHKTRDAWFSIKWLWLSIEATINSSRVKRSILR